MISKNMKIEDLHKLNYYTPGMEISPNILVQFIPDKKDQKRFMDDYYKLIEKVLSDELGLGKMLSNFMKHNRKYKFLSLINLGTSEYYISYRSLVQSLVTALCGSGKNKDLFLPNALDLRAYLDEEVNLYRNEFVNTIRTIRKQLSDMLREEYINSNEVLTDYNAIVDFALLDEGISLNSINARSMVEKMTNALTKLIFANKRLSQVCGTNSINLDDYNIDVEKYAFYMFSTNLQNAMMIDLNVAKQIYPVLSYFEDTRNDSKNNLFYYGYNRSNGKYDKYYNYRMFLKDLQEYVKTHKEVNCDIIPFDYFTDGWNYDDIEEFLDIFTSETFDKFIDTDTLFLPDSKNVSDRKVINKKKEEEKEKVFSLLPLEKREFYAKNKNRIYKSVLGENKFKGYVANILNNGYIIFEKYDVKEGDISTKNAAAYIMNIFNFNALCTMNISEIREFIKSQDKSKPLFERVDFRCHRGNWQEYIQRYIDEDTGFTSSDVEELLKDEKIRPVQYKKEKEEE